MVSTSVAILTLIALEAVVRFTYPEYRRLFARYAETPGDEKNLFCRFDAALGWRNIPGAEGEFARREFRHHVRHNNLGMRGEEVAAARPSPAPRLIALGDSFTWGYGVEETETYCHRIGEALDAEMLNLGVSGYGTGQELLLLREVIDKVEADGVLLFFDPATDLADVRDNRRWGYAKPRFTLDGQGKLELAGLPSDSAQPSPATAIPATEPANPWFNRLAESSTLFNMAVAGLASRSWSAREYLRETGIVGPWVAWDDTEVYRREPTEEVEDAWKVVGALLHETKTLLDEHGMRLTVIQIPGKVQVRPRLDPAAYDPALPTRRLAAICQAAGIPFIDPTDALHNAFEVGGPPPYYRYDPHLTAVGHRIVADVVARELRVIQAGPAPPLEGQ